MNIWKQWINKTFNFSNNRWSNMFSLIDMTHMRKSLGFQFQDLKPLFSIWTCEDVSVVHEWILVIEWQCKSMKNQTWDGKDHEIHIMHNRLTQPHSCITNELTLKVVEQLWERVSWLREIKFKDQLGINKIGFKNREVVGRVADDWLYPLLQL